MVCFPHVQRLSHIFDIRSLSFLHGLQIYVCSVLIADICIVRIGKLVDNFMFSDLSAFKVCAVELLLPGVAHTVWS